MKVVPNDTFKFGGERVKHSIFIVIYYIYIYIVEHTLIGYNMNVGQFVLLFIGRYAFKYIKANNAISMILKPTKLLNNAVAHMDPNCLQILYIKTACVFLS